MAAFLTLNGVAIPVFRDSLKEDWYDVGNGPVRGPSGVVISTRTARLRKWTFQTPPMAPAIYNFYRKWIEGFGGYWSWDTWEKISSVGFTNTAAGTWTYPSGTAGKYGDAIEIGSASVFGAKFSYRMGVQRVGGYSPSTDGITMLFWRNSAGYAHWNVTGAGVYLRNAAANPSGFTQYKDGVVGSHSIGVITSIHETTSPYTGLHGYLTGGAGSAMTFDEWVVLPMAIPATGLFTGSTGKFTGTQATIAADIYTFHNSRRWSDLPKLIANGDFLAGESAVQIFGCVPRMSQMNANGDHNYRQMEVELWETL